MLEMCMDLTDAQGDLRTDCDIKKGEIYLKRDLRDLQRNVTLGNSVFPSPDLKKPSEDENVSQEMLPMNFTQISF